MRSKIIDYLVISNLRYHQVHQLRDRPVNHNEAIEARSRHIRNLNDDQGGSYNGIIPHPFFEKNLVQLRQRIAFTFAKLFMDKFHSENFNYMEYNLFSIYYLKFVRNFGKPVYYEEANKDVFEVEKTLIKAYR